MIVELRRSDWWSLPNEWLGLQTRRAVTLRIAPASQARQRSTGVAPIRPLALSQLHLCHRRIDHVQYRNERDQQNAVTDHFAK